MSKIKLPFLSAAAALLTATVAWGATLVAVWDGDFTQTITGYTLDLNNNKLEDGVITITNNVGVKIGFTTAVAGGTGATVLFRYSNMTLGDKKTIATSCVTQNGTGDRTGVRMDENGLLHGIWDTTGTYDTSVTTQGTATDAYAAGTWVFSYTGSSVGTHLTRVADGVATDLYVNGTLMTTKDTSIYGFTIGGPRTTGTFVAAADMQISKVAVFSGTLTAAEMVAYKFPSEITEYTATGVNGTVSWSDITFDNTWASSDASIANITLGGDATITLPNGFAANRINVNGTGTVTFKVVEGGTVAVSTWDFSALSNTSTLTWDAGSSTVIAGADTVLDVAGDNDIFSIAFDKKLTVKSGALTAAKVSNSGTLHFDGGTEEAPISITGGSYLGATTLAANTYVKNDDKGSNSKYTVTGSGVTSFYTLARNSTDSPGMLTGSAFTNVILVSAATGSNKSMWLERATVADTVGLKADGNITLSNLTPNPVVVRSLTGSYSVGNNGGQGLTIKPTEDAEYSGSSSLAMTIDAGTATQTFSGTYTGALTVNSGAKAKLSGSATPSSIVNNGTVTLAWTAAKTLPTSSGTGTFEVTDGTVTVPTATPTYSVTWTAGTLKVSVTDTEWSSGVTLGDNFTVADGQNVTFVHGTSEVTGTGKVLAAQGVTWTGNASNGLWSDAANWSGNAVPTATDVVKFTADAEVILTTDDVAPAGVLISDDVTLTINGAGTIGGVTGGNLVKKGEGALNIFKNAEGYSINGTKVTIEQGQINDPAAASQTNVGKLKDLELTLWSGTTIKCYGFPGCEGTMTINTDYDVDAFGNLGNVNSIKLENLTSFTKKGTGTLTMKAVLENTTVTIEGGKLIFDTKAFMPSGLTVTGSGDFGIAAGVTMTPPKLSDFTGKITGAGTLTYSGSLPDATYAAYYQNDAWTGTVKIENKTGLTNFNPNSYGNANSKIILSGVEGYFVNSSSTHLEIKPTIELVDGSYGFGLKISNGWGTDWVQFDKITGSGTYMMTPPNNTYNPTRRHFFPDVTGFTGALVLTGTNASGVKNVSTIFVGRDWTNYTDDGATVNGKIFVSGTLPTAVRARNEIGDIVVSEGATATKSQLTAVGVVSVAGTVTTTSAAAQAIGTTNRIDVASSGVLEFVTSANQDDTYAVFTNITGTGTIKYSGKGYHTLPAYSTNIWANTLGVCIEQTDGMLLMLNGTANEPFVYECGSLSGSKDIRVDWTDVKDSRSLRVTQSKDSEWSGKFMPCSSNRDRFNTLFVAGAADATEKTLTISGTNFDAQCSNTLEIESTGSVNLTGKWIGDVTVDGILSGTGTASGTITFGSTGTLLCTPGKTISLGTLAMGTDVSAIQVAIPAGTELTEARYTLMTFSSSQETIPVFTWTNASDYPMYKIVATSEGLKLTKSGFTINVR